jgi:eukaryotic-like serine/threonine-protein kinase
MSATLEGPSGDDPAQTQTHLSLGLSGGTIGFYRLLERLGQGGMGEVWLAEQTRPVRRQAALKFIKAGVDTAQVVARFEAERQALAIMEHPSIARVFDAGATDLGRPYFVMEYVRGESLTSYCGASASPLARSKMSPDTGGGGPRIATG